MEERDSGTCDSEKQEGCGCWAVVSLLFGRTRQGKTNVLTWEDASFRLWLFGK